MSLKMMSPQVAAGSVVLKNLPAQVVAAGVPAKIIGVATEGRPSETVDQNLEHVRYHSRTSKGTASANGNGERNSTTTDLSGKSDDSGMRGPGARRGSPASASAAASAGLQRRRGVGVRGIEEKERSFL